VRYYVLRSSAPIESYSDLSTYQSIINVFPLFREYLTGLLWPFNLNFWHTFHPISSLFEAKGIIPIVVTVIYFVVSMVAYRKNRPLFFGLLLLLIPLLPAFYINGIPGKPFAERYLYCPSVGFVFLLAVFLSWAKEELPRAVRSITIVFIVIAGLYSIGTLNRNNVWKDEFIFWSDTVKKSPDNTLAHNNLGLAYMSKGQVDVAMAEYEIALTLKPDHAEAHNNLGLAYMSKGQVDIAMAEFETALRLNPGYSNAHNNLGNVYADKGQLDKAMAEYQTVLLLDPSNADAHNNLGCLFESVGQLDKAMTEFETALRLKPNHKEAHNNLAVIYLRRQGGDGTQRR
jgi:Flp pilus assembly protein TadD